MSFLRLLDHSRAGRARRGIVSLLAGALLLSAARLAAGPVLKIESIDTGGYPTLEARAVLHHPYPERLKEEKNEQASRFEVRERDAAGPPDLWDQAVLKSIHELPAPETRLYLVLVLDTTRSVPARDFQRSIETSVGLVRSLKDGESAAIYRINARPLLASGFVSDKDALVNILRKFKRDGRVTRLYDSLHSAVITAHRTSLAAQAAHPPGVRERTAIVLLTDGRDEGSFLTDSDCVELAALSHSYDIPVYTILYGKSKNLAALTRLSARTGGVLIRGFDQERIEKIPAELREPNARHFRLRYRTALDPGGLWPIGRRIEVRVGFNAPASLDAAEAAYTLPFPRGLLLLLERRNMALYLGVAGLAFGLLLLLLLLVVLGLRARKRRRLQRSARPIAHGQVPSQLVEMEVDEDERQLPIVAAEEVDDAVPPVVEEDDDFFVDTVDPDGPVRGGTHEHDEYVATSAAPHDYEEERAVYERDLSREKRRIMQPVRERSADVYMRDYSYRMLQNALRQAERYSEASLVRERPRQSPTEYDIFLETTILGTGRWANIHLDDPSASPIHAKIRQVDHRFVIYDMLSAAGVYLNGRKILRPMPLADGDRIQLGRTLLEFRGTV